ncbi:RNA polymerase sigma factor [Streptomyces avicenniae]|uniref:RNA polymerase sigma factor n=1 Tax=Streptomyces avicenniae TaxID=500153 RepID=UPI000AD620D0|nr:sigma-70 family RNA polymerase sigma factor [Streptomyces avicenniae]
MRGQREAGTGSEEEPPPVREQTERIRAVLALGGVPWGDLDDGLQQVRLKLLTEEAGPGRGVRDRDAWSAVVASRVAVDWHRARAREAGLRARLAARWERHGGTEHPQEDLPLALSVARGLESLSRPQRQVITLRYYMDLSVAEIASLLGIPEGTVKSRLHSAAAALRGRLTEKEGDFRGRG